MKLSKHALLLMIGFILLISGENTLFAQKSSVLEIKGHIFHGEERIEKALVKLYQNNKVVQMMYTKKNGKFSFILFSGIQYMVEVSNPGFVPERIQISTKEPTEYSGKYLYEFKVDLMSLKKFKGIDISSLDFPTAIIKYYKKEGEYLHDKVYSKSVKEELKKLKGLARSQ